jgi:3-oxoacyl-[acyl-carrier protein] reductase
VRIDLTGRVALVTGASRGIGRAIAEALAGAGAQVCINYRTQFAAAKETLTAIEQAGGQGFVHQADVANSAEVQAMVEAVLARCGRLDILVNNAGLTRDRLLLEMEDEDWDAVLRTNLDGIYSCCRAAAVPLLRQRWGRIINISSVTAVRGMRGQVNYAASKGGVNAFTRALAVELAPKNITVNAIAPGLIETDMSRPVIELATQSIRDLIPMRRPGLPREVAPVAVFLASDAAAYITGQVIAVDGGLA